MTGTLWGGGAQVGEAADAPVVVTTYTLGLHLRSVAFNNVTNMAYAGNEGSNSISVIDGATNSLVDTDGNAGNGITPIGVGDQPVSIAINEDTNRIYTANLAGQSVSVINGDTNTFITNIPVGGNASGVSANPNTNRIYVGDITNGRVRVIDGNTNSIVATIPLFPGAQPHLFGVVVNPDTNLVYVSDWPDSTVSVIDGDTDTKLVDLNVGGGVSALAVNPDTNLVYVSATNAGAVKILDGDTNLVVGSVPIPAPAGLTVDPLENKVYTADESTNRLYAIDAGAEVVDWSTPITATAFAVAFDSTRHRIYVGSWFSNVLSVVGCTPVSTAFMIGPGDADCDSFSDAEEGTIGTDPYDQCPDDALDDAWPADFVINAVINIFDLNQLTPPVFGTTGTPASHPFIFPRKDLVPSGTINIFDLNRVTPPVFGTMCS